MSAVRFRFVWLLVALAVTAAGCTGDDDRLGASRPSRVDAGPDVSSCVPVCQELICGDDGCGGSCGLCPSGSVCIKGVQCVFRPPCQTQCGGRACGNDGCGGLCGACAAGDVCVAGACVPPGQAPCARLGIRPSDTATSLDDDGSGNAHYFHRAVDPGTPSEALSLEIYQGAPSYGPAGTGVFPLDGTDYSQCGLCLLAYSYCDDQLRCGKTYLARAGSVEISRFGGVGERFSATVNAVLEQVTIDRTTYRASPVANGEFWCLEDYTIDDLVTAERITEPGPVGGEEPEEPPAPASSCQPNGTGVQLTNHIADFTLRDCNGNFVPLHSFCGQTKILWLLASAGWCPACETYVPLAAAAEDFMISRGVSAKLLVVLGQDPNGLEPSPAYCHEYAARHGLDPDQVLIDGAFLTLHANIYAYSRGILDVPWEALLDGDDMRYVWSSGSDSAGVATGVAVDVFRRLLEE